jgi:hypothetical protein
MATFKFGRTIDLHWNGYDIQGPAETVFSIPDQLYEEFNADIAPVEPTLVWIDTNEFQTLKDSVPTGTYVKAAIGTSPISVSTSSSTATISLNSGTAANGYLLAANGTGGTIWTPASTSGLTSVVGISPISSVISGGTVSVSLSANYQTAGTYASSVSATSPISATLSTAGVLTLSIDATLTSADSATRTRSKVRNSTVSTIAKGSFVYIDGSNGTVPTIQKALANADATSSRTFGIVEEDITSNTDGYVTNQGLITGIDTSAFADGNVLWLSPTIAGSATTTKPTGPNHGVLLGIVVKGASVGAGSIYVFIKNGAELDEIHDVNISSIADGQALIYSSTASVWQNKVLPVASVSGTSPISASTTTATGAVALSIAAGSINSTHLSASSVGASQIIDGSVGSAEIATGAVNTAKISSGAATSGQLLRADGAGNASFATITSGTQAYVTTLSGTGTWTVPTGVKEFELFVMSPGGGGGGGGLLRATSVPSTNGGAAGGGGGGSGSFVYIPRYPVESGTTSYSYSLATPGTGAATISGSQGATVVKTNIESTGNSGGNASGATTFGPYITISAANGGTGGTASKSAATTQGTGGIGSSVTLSNNLYFENVIYGLSVTGADGAPLGQGNAGSGQNVRSLIGSTNIGTFYGVHSLIANGYPIVAESYTTQAALVATVSQSGNTASVTSAIGTVNSASSQNMNGIPGGSAGGGGSNGVSPSAGNGRQGVNNAGNSGCGVSVTYAVTGQGTITIVGSTGASGKAGTGGGGGGGGGVSLTSSATTANQTATGYVITSGGGGDGGTGLIFIRYIA